MDEELWVEEDGRPVAAYMLTMLRAAEKVQIETTEEQLEGRQKPYRTSIVIMNHLYSQTTTENVVIDTSAAIKRALTTCAHQNNFENFVSEAAHKPWLRHVLMPPIGITERSTIEADVHIGHIRWHSAPDKEPSGADNIDLNRREAIEAIENRY
ncbi:hypothetical protein AAVH_30042 [Aphelenchoides avenae]|nr:hypothetical protein AAVH_30042 [Aphelenchus avenae]